MLVSRSLSFVFPLFYFFSCWLSSTYDLIWIFVAFLTATGVVSLKSDFAIRYQHVPLLSFFSFLLFIFIYSFTFCFALIFLAWQFYTRSCHKGVDHIAANWSQQDSASPVRWNVISFLFFLVKFFQRDFNWATIQFIYLADIFS